MSISPFSVTQRFGIRARCTVTLIFSTLLVWGIAPAPGVARAEGALSSSVEVQCEIFRDSQQVFHVRVVETAPEAGAPGSGPRLESCVGYLHGLERGEQMEFLRRTAQGRKAEIAGWRAIREDFLMRLLGLAEQAERLWGELDPEARARFSAYARGVNQGFAEAARRKRGGRWVPTEDWRPQDAILMTLLQSFDQTRKGFTVELDEQARLNAADDAAASFEQEGLPWETTILKPGEFPARTREPAPRRTSFVRSEQHASLYDFLGNLGGGSNNWVVSPARSQSGKALLANDPHLSLKDPPFWFWMGWEGDGVHAIGATLPGVPIIASGTNERVAWGLTNSYLDSADVAAIPEKELQATPLQSIRPWIWFRWGFLKLPFFFKKAERTARGWPILPLETAAGHRLVLHWSGFDLTGPEVASFLNLVRVKSAQEADERLASVGVPSWNFVFADTAGHIGYRAMGKVFKRKQAPAPGVVKTSLQEFEARDYLAPHEMPQLFDPRRGYVVTANNRHWPSSALYHGGRAYSRGFRAHRIEERLGEFSRHDLRSTAEIQCDVQSGEARFLLPLLLPLLRESEAAGRPGSEVARALQLFEGWDFEMRTDCQACSLFRRWVDRFYSVKKWNETDLYRALLGIKKAPRGDVQSQELKKTLAQALVEAWRELTGGTAARAVPAWGEIHRAYFHSLSGDPLEGQVTWVASRGDGQTVDPGTAEWVPAEPSDAKSGGYRGGYYDHHTGASQRLIVELSNPPQVWAVLAGPNSSSAEATLDRNSGSWARWARCEKQQRIFPLNWEPIQGDAAWSRVTLKH